MKKLKFGSFFSGFFVAGWIQIMLLLVLRNIDTNWKNGFEFMSVADIIPSFIIWGASVAISSLVYWYINRKLEPEYLRVRVISFLLGGFLVAVIFYNVSFQGRGW